MKGNKRSKKSGKKKNFYLTILDHVRKYNSLPDIGSAQRRNYYLKSLKARGILIKKGYGTWEINEEKLKELTNKKSGVLAQNSLNTFLIRGHNFQFLIKSPREYDWKKTLEYKDKELRGDGGSGVHYKLLRNGVYRLMFRGHKIWLCHKKVIIHFPDWKDYYGFDATEGQESAIHDALSLVKGLECFLNVKLNIQGKVWLSVTKQHYAKVKDELARYCKENKEKIEVRDDKGELWLLVDFSGGGADFETVHSKTSKDDMNQAIIPTYNFLRDYYIENGVAFDLRALVEISRNNALTNKKFAENIESHIEAIKVLSSAVNDLRKEVNRLGDR